MGKTVSKAQRFSKRDSRDHEDMKGFLRSKQKGPQKMRPRDYRELTSEDWQSLLLEELAESSSDPGE
jgi:hypothetical protein